MVNIWTFNPVGIIIGNKLKRSGSNSCAWEQDFQWFDKQQIFEDAGTRHLVKAYKMLGWVIMKFTRVQKSFWYNVELGKCSFLSCQYLTLTSEGVSAGVEHYHWATKKRPLTCLCWFRMRSSVDLCNSRPNNMFIWKEVCKDFEIGSIKAESVPVIILWSI